MSNTFQRHLLNPGTTAGWLTSGPGGLYHRTLGFAFDSFLADDARRILSSLPGFSSAATIGETGHDRDMLLLPEMTFAAQQQACREWIPAHQDAGLGMGIGRQVQSLFAPENPTVRIVWGNSTRANWATVYGDDGIFEIDYARGLAAMDIYHPTRPYWDVRRDPSNWDWWSDYFAQPEVADVEPARLFNVWVILYMPASVELWPSDVAPDPLTSIGSTMSVRASINLAIIAAHWATMGIRLAGWILASDFDSFDPMNDNTGVPGGYPDGRWWRVIDETETTIRLATARYYHDLAPGGVGP